MLLLLRVGERSPGLAGLDLSWLMEGAGPARGEGAKRLSTSMLRRVSAHVAPSRVLGLGVLLLILLFALLFILLAAVVLRVGCSRPTGVGCKPSVGEGGY